MTNVLLERLRQGNRTSRFPRKAPDFPPSYRGRPLLFPSRCTSGCRGCEEVCPTRAVHAEPLRLDLGACLFCGRCEEACPAEAIVFSPDHRLSVSKREDLMLSAEKEFSLAGALDAKMKSLLGRSLKLRQVSAGGCNACEVEVAVLGIVVYDLGRFGIQYVASPRHADGILITGPVTKNMVHALRETYAAVPPPKLVIAVGACALSGGLFANTGETLAGVPDDIRVDLFIPGCPPHPFTLLDGYLRLLGKIDQKMDKRFRDAVSSSPASR